MSYHTENIQSVIVLFFDFFLRDFQVSQLMEKLGLNNITMIHPMHGNMSLFSLQQKFIERIKRNKDNIPKHVMQVIQEEQRKLAAIKFISESTIVYNYLDWLTILPWRIYRFFLILISYSYKYLYIWSCSCSTWG